MNVCRLLCFILPRGSNIFNFSFLCKDWDKELSDDDDDEEIDHVGSERKRVKT